MIFDNNQSGSSIRSGLEGITFEGMISGTVVSTIGGMKVNIPKLYLPGPSSVPVESSVSVSDSMILNQSGRGGVSGFTQRNYIKPNGFKNYGGGLKYSYPEIPPNGPYPIVIVFLDGDPKKPYYLPFSI